jgi:hypothetical protein
MFFLFSVVAPVGEITKKSGIFSMYYYLPPDFNQPKKPRQ